MCSVFLPLFFLCQLKTGTEIECRGYVRFNLAFRSDVLAVNTNGSSGESYGARWRIRASNKGMSIAPLSRACLNTVLKPAGHQTIGKLLASVRRSKNDERRTELVTDHYLCSAYQDSKLMESCVASNITNHVVTQNLLDNRQWAYRKGKSTEQLLIHLTERWREAVERNFLWEYCLWISLKLSTQFSQYIATKAERPWNQRRYLAVVKELSYLTERRQFPRYTRYSSRSAARVGPRVHVILPLHKRPPKITTLCGNLSVCRRHNNILSQKQWIC